MNNAERAALLQELKRSTGQTNPDGSPHIDPEEVTDPVVLAQIKRPSREQIKALAARLAPKLPANFGHS